LYRGGGTQPKKNQQDQRDQLLQHRQKRGGAIKILFLSPIFPNRQDPAYGVFSLRLVQNFQAAGLHVTVIAPVPYAPAWLWFNKDWRKLGLIPESEDIGGVKVLHPRYFCLPGGRFERLNGYSMFLAVEPVAEILHRAVSFSLIHAGNDHQCTCRGVGHQDLPFI
jgi:hypothetical protein